MSEKVTFCPLVLVWEGFIARVLRFLSSGSADG